MTETGFESTVGHEVLVQPQVRRPAPKWLIPSVIALVVGIGAIAGYAANDKSAQLSQQATTIRSLEAKVSGYQKQSDDIAAQQVDLQKKLDQVSATLLKIQAGTIPGDGTFRVGPDVQPGTYTSQGNATGCYWARLGSANTSDIIDNNNVVGQGLVTILLGDAVFETHGCADWTKAG